MIKGIQGHGYYDELVIPIIENTAYENELTDSLAKAVCFFCVHLVNRDYEIGFHDDHKMFMFYINKEYICLFPGAILHNQSLHE